MTGDYRQNVITNLRCCFKFYGPRHFTLNLIFCCFTFCDKLNFLSLVRILWQTEFCDKLNFVTNCILWQTAFCDKLHFVTNWILWQTEFCDKLHFVTNCILWQTAFCDKLHFVTNCILWQTAFSVVSRPRRMVTNIGRSHVSRSYPFLSQTLSTAVTDLK
jgi:hypothetical protein